MVQQNYLQIKADVQDIIQSEMETVLGDPRMEHLVIKKLIIIQSNSLQKILPV